MANFFKEYKAQHTSKIELKPGEDFTSNRNTGVDHSQIEFYDGKNLTKREAMRENTIMGIEPAEQQEQPN